MNANQNQTGNNEIDNRLLNHYFKELVLSLKTNDGTGVSCLADIACTMSEDLDDIRKELKHVRFQLSRIADCLESQFQGQKDNAKANND
ncbi:MAG: hypothetical protein IJG38_03855 [Thermoguttaceae bacterium]|nr:hypothetical protein [Thermoguttaceae bacterium]